MKSLFLVSCLAVGLIAGNFFRAKEQTPASPALNAADSAHDAQSSAPATALTAWAKFEANLDSYPTLSDATTSPDVAEIQLSARAALACRGLTSDECSELMDHITSGDLSYQEKITALRMIVNQWGQETPTATLAAINKLPKDLRSLAMDTLWGAWAKVDLAGLREYTKSLHETAQSQGIQFVPSEALMKADVIGSLNRCLSNDQHDFSNSTEVSFKGKPTEISFKSGAPPGAKEQWHYIDPDCETGLRAWLNRDSAAATAWTREAITSQPLHVGLEYFLIDVLSQEGANAAAAQLAAEHLAGPFADSVLKRILPRWEAQDPSAANAWKAASGR